MDVTRKQLTNVEAGKSEVGGPPNLFNNIAAFPTADMKVVVRPNFDTLYSRRGSTHQGADDRLRARHRRTLLSPADARHVDQRLRLARLAHDRNAGRQLPDRAAALERHGSRRRHAHRCADALCLDHRPHQDRRPAGLRGGAPDPGRLQDHAAVRMGPAGPAGRGQDRSHRST